MSIKTIIFILLFAPLLTMAQSVDTDGDGWTNEEEINIYHTYPDKADTDNDGYNDKLEYDHGYSPHRAGEWQMWMLDWDKDGLNDALEFKFGTGLRNPDSDGDGYLDGDEVSRGYDPRSNSLEKLPKKIVINTARQEMGYRLDDIELGKFKISSGKPGMATPLGEFKVQNKIPLAWSRMAGLWMPYWMAFTPSGMYGIHELPYWPNGYREGEDHLGTPVSHGCVRLGLGAAEFMYNWAEVGTPVVIVN